VGFPELLVDVEPIIFEIKVNGQALRLCTQPRDALPVQAGVGCGRHG